MKKRINIIYIIDTFCDPGGTETHLTRLVSLLDPERFHSMIVAFDLKENYLIRRIRDAGIEVIHIPVGSYYNYDALRKGLILSKLIRDNHIDIVQTYHFKSDFYGALIAYLSGARHIISSKRDVGDIKTRLHFLLNSMTTWLFDGYIAVADEVADIVSEKEKVNRRRITTIYNGVDTEIFSVPRDDTRKEARNSLGIGPLDYVIGMVAALRPEKNHPVLFEAVRKARESVREIKALVVGGGVLLDKYKNMCRDLGIINEVIFTGWSEDVLTYLRTLDVACLIPGNNEGFSNSIIEKMAMGLPMVVTHVGGNAEAVVDGFNGFVIPVDDPDALSKAFVMLYMDPDLRREMGARSRQRIMDHFTLEGMVRNHENYYEAVMKSRRK